MQFWLRHLFLVVACVVVPFGAALYVDTMSEVDRSQSLGVRAASLALDSLQARLELEAFQLIASAQELGERVMEDRRFEDLQRDTQFSLVAERLAQGVPKGGFAWLVDDSGQIVAQHDTPTRLAPDQIRSIAGHPAYQFTQLGLALDTFLIDDGRPYFVAAVPLVRDAAAEGAMIVGRPVNEDWLQTIKVDIGAEIAFGSSERIFAATMERSVVDEFQRANGFEQSEPLHVGRLDRPLSADLPGLPLLIDPYAEGLVYTATHKPLPGSRTLQWMVAVRSADSLSGLAQRQTIVLAGLAASLMLAILIGLINSRTFVRPLAVIEHHLSEIQLGRGELELPERRVAGPFRRLVRLINMTVQKIPARGLSTIADRPSWAETDTREASAPGMPADQVPTFAQEPAFGGRARGSNPLGSTDLQPSRPSSGAETGPVFARAAAPPHSVPRPPASDPAHDLFESEVDMPAPEVQTASLGAGNTTMPLGSLDMEPIDPEAAGPGPFAPSPPPSFEASDEPTADAVEAAIQSMGLRPEPEGPATRPQAAPLYEAGSESDPFEGAVAVPGTGAPRRRPSEVRGAPPPSVGDLDEGFPVELTGTGPAPVYRSGGSAGPSALDLSAFAGMPSADDDLGPESTVVAPVAEDLLAKSASRDEAHGEFPPPPPGKESTVVASVPDQLIVQSRQAEPEDPSGLDDADQAHFREVFERFVEMRQRCGEGVDNLGFERFMQKLRKNREAMIKKYSCRTVRFQVYEKDGKAALKASPVRK